MHFAENTVWIIFSVSENLNKMEEKIFHISRYFNFCMSESVSEESQTHEAGLSHINS